MNSDLFEGCFNTAIIALMLVLMISCSLESDTYDDSTNASEQILHGGGGGTLDSASLLGTISGFIEGIDYIFSAALVDS